MPPTIISRKASNWVDRGEPARFTITRVLSRFLNQNPADRRDWFDEQAEIIQAMVAADATEERCCRRRKLQRVIRAPFA